MEYCVYSDESYITAERFRSITAFSFPVKYHDRIQNIINEILDSSNVEELKWQKIRNAKNKFCAEKLINFIFQNIFLYNIRIDAIIWDTQDSRHTILGRDDDANFERMFFHLIKNLMLKRGKNSIWNIYPDEKLNINWATIYDCLQNMGKKQDYFVDMFGKEFSDQYYKIENFREIISAEEPCSQVADFFAGLAVFSKNQYSDFTIWTSQNSPQLDFFEENTSVNFSNSQKCRFKILQMFIEYCQRFKMGVSLNSGKCLNTPNPKNPINFWNYTPQHEDDKAPRRENIKE